MIHTQGCEKVKNSEVLLPPHTGNHAATAPARSWHFTNQGGRRCQRTEEPYLNGQNAEEKCRGNSGAHLTAVADCGVVLRGLEEGVCQVHPHHTTVRRSRKGGPDEQTPSTLQSAVCFITANPILSFQC